MTDCNWGNLEYNRRKPVMNESWRIFLFCRLVEHQNFTTCASSMGPSLKFRLVVRRASQIAVDHFPISPNSDSRLPQIFLIGTQFPAAPHLAADTIEAPSLSGPSWSRPTGISGKLWDGISMFPCEVATVRHDWPASVSVVEKKTHFEFC